MGRLFAICFVGGGVSPLRALLNMAQIVLGPAEEAADVGTLVIKTELGDGIGSCVLGSISDNNSSRLEPHISRHCTPVNFVAVNYVYPFSLATSCEY